MYRLAFAALLAFIGQAASATTYTLEPNYTQGVLRWDHLGFSYPAAQFAQGTGTLEFDEGNPTMSSIRVTIPMASLNTGVPDLDEHLKSEDFFEVAKYPTATFVSTRVDKGAGMNRFRITGDLTIRKVTRPVTLDVTLLKVGKNARTEVATIGFDARGTLKRSDFGLGAFVPQVGDEIQLLVTTQAAEARGQAAYLEAQKSRK
ncbi:MAG TPA: YceI family protein [Steroidobacteraceae bacterium]|nr:YceI family protein [Steroidobacteraceae bacterium]